MTVEPARGPRDWEAEEPRVEARPEGERESSSSGLGMENAPSSVRDVGNFRAENAVELDAAACGSAGIKANGGEESSAAFSKRAAEKGGSLDEAENRRES